MPIRPLAADDDDAVALVAARMRATLEEVLGEARGRDMYSLDWLRGRVRWHLDPARAAAGFVLEGDDGAIVGHTLVREEPGEDGAPVGLFATTYVLPAARRRGAATALLRHGEAWMRRRGLPQAWTYTADRNLPLIGLYQREGYVITLAVDAMVRLAKPLGAAVSAPR
jgi:GNAT superfamily N-acetyltransferase